MPYKRYLWNSEEKSGIPRRTEYRIRRQKNTFIENDVEPVLNLSGTTGPTNTGEDILSSSDEDNETKFFTENEAKKRRISDTDGSFLSMGSENEMLSQTIKDRPNDDDFSSNMSSGTSSVHSGRSNSTSSWEEQSVNSNAETNDDILSFENLEENDASIVSTELDEEIYPDAAVNLKQFLILVMAHIVRFKLCKESTASLLKLLSFFLPEKSKIPRTLFLFYKHFEAAKSNYTFHLYCKNKECNSYIGLTSAFCKHCDIYNCVESALENGNYFLVFSIEDQIQTLLQERDRGAETMKTNREPAFNLGSAYKSLPMGKYDLSVTWNTDGVPVFHSSGYSIWPLLYTVNELDNNTVQLAALWFGCEKPEMNCFLKPFVDEMNRLSKFGFIYNHNETRITVKVFPGAGCCDSVARCTLQNTTQFNGKYGCNWCLHEGTSVKKGNGQSRIYEFKRNVASRDAQQMARDAKDSIQNKTRVNGVKGFSILMLLSYFDIVKGFSVDYMHCVCQGVVKAIASLWFDTSSHKEHYYIGRNIEALDNTLQTLKPPNEISRLPKSITERKQWKANEWRSWLLFYSPHVLRGHLPEKFYNHWLNLVLAVNILLSSELTLDMVDEASYYLELFVKKFEKLYGREHMTYNIHLLLHLPDTAKNWGPLWLVSCFQFENMNGKLMALFHGTQKVPIQIAEKYIILRRMRQLSENAFANSRCLEDYLLDLLRGYPYLKKITKIESNTFAHSLPRRCKLNKKQILAIESDRNRDISSSALIFSYDKMTIGGLTFSTKCTSNRNNCGIQFKDGEYGFIDSFVSIKQCGCDSDKETCFCDKEHFILAKKVLKKNGHASRTLGKICQKVKLSKKIIAYSVKDLIVEKLIVLDYNGKMYVANFPNMIECD